MLIIFTTGVKGTGRYELRLTNIVVVPQLTFVDEVDVGDDAVVLRCQLDHVALQPQPLVLHTLGARAQTLYLHLELFDATLLGRLHL